MERGYFDHNCEKCQGLCCIATVRTGEGFASQDQIGQPCKHLTGDFRCRVHHQLEKKGFAECVPYRCKSAGNRLTRILRIGGIPDITKPKNPRQKDLARVISEIFKDIEWIMSFLEGFQKKGLTEKFELFQKEAETLFQEIEAIVRTEGNVYVIIPKTVELNARIRAVKKKLPNEKASPWYLASMLQEVKKGEH